MAWEIIIVRSEPFRAAYRTEVAVIDSNDEAVAQRSLRVSVRDGGRAVVVTLDSDQARALASRLTAFADNADQAWGGTQ